MHYKLMVVVDPVAEEGETQQKLTTLLNKEGFVVSEVVPLGKKALAYPIAKINDGLYFSFRLEGKVDPKNFSAKFQQEASVIRTLVLKERKIKIKAKVKPQAVAAIPK